MKTVPYGKFELTLREINEEDRIKQQLPSRPAGVYLMDNVVVLDDLTMWSVVDKKDVE
jgi:hypothetical protein